MLLILLYLLIHKMLLVVQSENAFEHSAMAKKKKRFASS